MEALENRRIISEDYFLFFRSVIEVIKNYHHMWGFAVFTKGNFYEIYWNDFENGKFNKNWNSWHPWQFLKSLHNKKFQEKKFIKIIEYVMNL